MGFLQQGQWHSDMSFATDKKGDFVRRDSQFRHWVKRDGSSEFAAEANRYHLYVSYACPWASRTLIMRAVKGLQHCIDVTVVEPLMLENGWEFSEGGEPVMGKCFLYELYQFADPAYSGRVTVPVLWDKKNQTIVNNESADIMRMMNSEWQEFASSDVDYAPKEMLKEIDEINQYVYDNVNNGVYRCGFAVTQAAYDRAFDRLFAALDSLEERLSERPYLLGSRLTEADWRLFVTLIRFDVVYVGHFKCNRQRIADYPHLTRYLHELLQYPGVAETVHFDHIKQHYYGSHRHINPSGIVPKGPGLGLACR